MPGKYVPNKVPMEDKVDATYPGSARNERYLNVVKPGNLGNGIMGHASDVMQVNPDPNYDINKVNYSDYENKGTPSEAFKYKY